jgi:hypothetical protein
VLQFKLAPGWRIESAELKAYVTLPNLKGLHLSGAVTARLLGFDTERLKIKASGATRISGKDNRVHYLSVDGSGALFSPMLHKKDGKRLANPYGC